MISSEDWWTDFFDYFDLGLTVQFALEIFENFFGVLKGLIVKVEQDKTGVIRHVILNKKIFTTLAGPRPRLKILAGCPLQATRHVSLTITLVR